MAGAVTQKEKPEFEYRIIKGDYGTDVDVGLVRILNDHTSRDHHWVRFPNGELRRWYKFDVLDEARFDEMEAFEMAPRLNVSYRPVSRILHAVHEGFVMFTALALVWIMLMGLVEVVAAFYFDWSLVKSIAGNWILHISFAAFWALFISSIISCIGHMRFNHTPNADNFPRNWEHKRIEAMRKGNHGWF